MCDILNIILYNCWVISPCLWFLIHRIFLFGKGLLWSLSYGSWIYNYLCNECLSPLMVWVRILLKQGVLNITYDKVCQWLAAGHWFSPGTLKYWNIVESDVIHHNPNPILIAPVYHFWYIGFFFCYIKYIYLWRTHFSYVGNLFCHINIYSQPVFRDYLWDREKGFMVYGA